MKKLHITALFMIAAAPLLLAQDAAAPRRTRPANRPAANAELIKEFDKDGDGKLSDEERKAMTDTLRERREKARLEREKEFDKDGDGKLNDEERKAMMEAIAKRREQARIEREKEFDKDGDGKLNEEERKAMREARGAGAPGGGGRRGRGAQ